MPHDRRGHSKTSSITNRRTFLSALGAGALAGLAGCSESLGSSGEVKNEYSFSTGPSDSLAFGMANQMASVLAQNSDQTMNVEGSTGTQAVSLLAQGETDLAYSSTFVGLNAKARREPFDDIEFNHELSQVISYYYIHVGQVAKTSSDLQRYSDVAGKPIGPGPSGASYWPPFEYALLKQISEDQLVKQNSSVSQFSNYLASDRVAAAGGPLNINGNIPSFTQQMYSENDVRLLSWSDEAISAIQEDPRVQGSMVPNDSMGDIQEYTSDEETFMISAVYNIWGSDRMPEQTVYDMLNTLWKQRSSLPDAHAGFGPWTEDEFWTSSFTSEIPVHPGTERFLKEKGLWSDEYTVAGN